MADRVNPAEQAAHAPACSADKLALSRQPIDDKCDHDHVFGVVVVNKG
jgi:hypothetical protein